MLGGSESFRKGQYEKTPLEEMSPVYSDRGPDTVADEGPFRLELTREGWLQPWMRVRATEAAERKRLEDMPPFQVLNPTPVIKPGASTLATVKAGDATVPALAVQRFGKGRAAALLVGDLWRWAMHREEEGPEDLQQIWRQTVRWVVADVPRRLEVKVEQPDDPSRPVRVQSTLRDPEFQPLDNASVQLVITPPDGKPLTLTAQADDQEPGLYSVEYFPQQQGGYRVEAIASEPDGSELGRRETGWSSQPGAGEFQTLQPNRRLLDEMAQATGGQVLRRSQLNGFVKGLPNRKVPITENWVAPYWHQPWLFGLAVLLLCGEWGLRRWKGLP